jgi:porphobilinogen synthase
MQFPATRLRRLRSTPAMRSFVRETHLSPHQLIYPLFVCEGEGIRREISSMPGVFNLSIDEALKEVEACAQLGLGGLLLFGLPDTKDEQGSGAYDPEGITQRALRAIKAHPASKSLVTIADVCLCEYTSHGHCGIVRRKGSPEEVRDLESGAVDFTIDNDASLELLARTALSLTQAGADVVAPSDMMDGRIEAIRAELDHAGLENTPVMSYASKFASAFYGPFREAAASAPQFGDRRTYQMDGANRREAMREIDQDIAEGADMLLMKPGMPYLDILREARDRFDLPMGVYQVSGEYSMLQAAFQRGWLEPERAMMESLLSFRRAGADFIVTYFAKDAARLLK